MPESVSTRSAYKMLTCIYLCRTLLFFAPYADFFRINAPLEDWIKAIDWSLQDYDREKARRKIENTKFDISLSADKLKAIYRQLKKGNRVC